MKEGLIITISREYGSGGRQIGEKLAQKLNIPFYDKEIVEMAARESGFDPQIIAQHEESLPSSFLYGVSSEGYYYWDMLPTQIFQIEYNVLKGLAQKGSCVIVGRCANHLLKDEFDCLNIFVHADLELRCKRALDEYEAKATNIKKTVETIDKHRARHFKHYADSVWTNAENYQLSLDSGKLGLDSCVDIIKAAVEGIK